MIVLIVVETTQGIFIHSFLSLTNYNRSFPRRDDTRRDDNRREFRDDRKAANNTWSSRVRDNEPDPFENLPVREDPAKIDFDKVNSFSNFKN